MTTMFTNYESAIYKPHCRPDFHPVSQKDSKIITNIKGEPLGVQVEHSEPLKLYFHIENIHEVNFEDLLSGTTLFEILTTTHKVILSHDYYTIEILNQNTNDLCITLPQTDMEVLKKETYTMRVTLKTTKAEYEVFAEKDGYLIIR